jgi:hypothetical protein
MYVFGVVERTGSKHLAGHMYPLQIHRLLLLPGVSPWEKSAVMPIYAEHFQNLQLICRLRPDSGGEWNNFAHK